MSCSLSVYSWQHVCRRVLELDLNQLYELCPCQAHGERNYHVFYELLAGLPVEQKEELYLQEAESYFYLNQVSEVRMLCSS